MSFTSYYVNLIKLRHSCFPVRMRLGSNLVLWRCSSVAFVIQFGILSLLVGMPLMTLHMTLGQYVGAGMVDMWRISPIFKVCLTESHFC